MENTQETLGRYLAFLTDCFTQKRFFGTETTKIHGVGAVVPSVLVDLGICKKIGFKRGFEWLKEKPTEKTAQIVLDAVKIKVNGGKVDKTKIVGGQQQAIEEKKHMTVAEAISVLKAKGYKIMAPKTEWVEV